jgi:uncharacterized protein with PQ loop repeat
VTNLADLLMCAGSAVFIAATVPQLIKIRRMQSAREISWAFTVMCLAATILFVGAKCLLECYNAAMFDSVATLQYTVLLIFKRRYG